MKGSLLAALWAAAGTWACGCAPAAPADVADRPVRVAVIGGMTETGFWQALAERFTKATGDRIEVTATGPKPVIAEAFKAGQADFITMHASDTIVHLVADGYATGLHPWLKNDLVIVGPASDPAGIKGMPDAVEAIRKIEARGCHFVVHSSLGAQEVLRDLTTSGGLTLRPEATTMLMSDKARQVLHEAARKNAYTLVGRIPFLSGKMPNDGLVLMVRGDERLRRPYLLAVADKARFPRANAAGAARLSEFLRREETQKWIGQYGRGQLDDQPLFFRGVAAPSR